MQNINSERKGLQKIEQLSYKRFVSFMQDLYSCMTDNKLDMNNKRGFQLKASLLLNFINYLT